MDGGLVAGDGAKLCSLVARPELNGHLVRLLRLVDDRWVVELEAPSAADERLKIKPANLSKVQTSENWSLELNRQAVAAQKSGEFHLAERTWTKVLDVTSTGTRGDQLKVLYGNRAAVRLKLGDAKGALQDADRCVSLDMTWEKGWVRKIDALESLGQIVRAYDVALDAVKTLNPDSRSQVLARRERLAGRPETQGFLRGEGRPPGVARLPDDGLLDPLGMQATGRLWSGSVDKDGQAGPYRILINGECCFEFPHLVCDISSSTSRIQDLADWATMATSDQNWWSRDPVSQVLSAKRFRAILCGKDLKPEDFVVHQLATRVASYPLTLFHALRKFDLPGSKAVLVVHVVGVEASKEAAYLHEIGTVLQSLVGMTTLLISYIGPLNATSSTPPHVDAAVFREFLTRPEPGAAKAFLFRGTYDEFLMSELYSPPDFVMAFHPGFHDDTYPWWPTLQFLLHEDVPLALTCYSDSDLASTQDMLTNNSLFTPRDVLQDGTRNPFAARLGTPDRTENTHLLCMRGIQKPFPKSGVVFDAAHTETMAMMVMKVMASGASTMTEAEAYILQKRARSYVEFSKALQKVRPCPRQGDTGLISAQYPEKWRNYVAVL